MADDNKETISLLHTPLSHNINYHSVSGDPDHINDNNNGIVFEKDVDEFNKSSNYNCLSCFIGFIVSTFMFFIILFLQVSVRIFARVQTVPMNQYPHIIVFIICLVNIPIEWLLKSSSSVLSSNYKSIKNPNDSTINKINHQYYNELSSSACTSSNENKERQTALILMKSSAAIRQKKYMLLFAALFDICNVSFQIFSLTHIKFSIDVMFLQQLSLPIGLVICKIIFYSQVKYTLMQYFGSSVIISGVLIYFSYDLRVWLQLQSSVNTESQHRINADQFMWYVVYLGSYMFTGFSWLLRERAICQVDPNDNEVVIQQVKELLQNYSNCIQLFLATVLMCVLSFTTHDTHLSSLFTWDVSVLLSNAKDMLYDLLDGFFCAAGVVTAESSWTKTPSTDITSSIKQCSYSYVYILVSILSNISYSFIVLNLLRYCHGVSPRSHAFRSGPGSGGHLNRFLDVLGRGDRASNSNMGMNIFWRASLMSFPLTYFISCYLLEPVRDKVFTTVQLLAVGLVTFGLFFVIVTPTLTTDVKKTKRGLMSRLGASDSENNLADISIGSIVSPLSLKDTTSPYHNKVINGDVPTDSNKINNDEDANKVSWNSTHAHEILPWNQPLDYLYPYAGTLHFHRPVGGAGAVHDDLFLNKLNTRYQDDDMYSANHGVNRDRDRDRESMSDSLAAVHNIHTSAPRNVMNDNRDQVGQEISTSDLLADLEASTSTSNWDTHTRGRRSTYRPRISLDPAGVSVSVYNDDGEAHFNEYVRNKNSRYSNISRRDRDYTNKRESGVSVRSPGTSQTQAGRLSSFSAGERSLRRLSSMHSAHSVESSDKGKQYFITSTLIYFSLFYICVYIID